jgi:hypothetical protein
MPVLSCDLLETLDAVFGALEEDHSVRQSIIIQHFSSYLHHVDWKLDNCRARNANLAISAPCTGGYDEINIYGLQAPSAKSNQARHASRQ